VARWTRSDVTTQTPSWLLEREAGLCQCGFIGKRRKGSYLEKTIKSGAGLLRQVMFSDELAHRPGALQRLDPRVNVIGFSGLARRRRVRAQPMDAPGLLPGNGGAGRGVRAAGGLLVKRVSVFIPLFTGSSSYRRRYRSSPQGT
jgi:hypothetical protein